MKKKKKKKQEKNASKDISEVRNSSNIDSGSEGDDFWMPPVGDCWDFDDGGDGWGSGSESEPETEPPKEEDPKIGEMELANLFFFFLFVISSLAFSLAVVDVASLGLLLCHFPAIYNFGDSNSNTGASAAAIKCFPADGPTIFGKYPLRKSDGRVLLDFMTENLSLPYVSAYFNSIGTNFAHGANFAIIGVSIRRQYTGTQPISLDIQIVQFDQFKSRSRDLYEQGDDKARSRLPNPNEFSKALYTLDIGQNDITLGFQEGVDVQAIILDLINQFGGAIRHLYKQGAKAFWIHNTAPLGCLPNANLLPRNKTILQSKDPVTGCFTLMNDMSEEFNWQLKEKVNELRDELFEAAITLVDMYTIMFELLTTFRNNFIAFNKNVTTDGFHRTEAANTLIAPKVVSGAFSDPHLPLHVGSTCMHSTLVVVNRIYIFVDQHLFCCCFLMEF